MKKLLYLLILLPIIGYSQIQVIHFNAGWNAVNDVKWVDDLIDCKVKWIDIQINVDAQSEHEIIVVPTIIVFNEGEEVKRYQADLSFKLTATREELQEFIDELIMSNF